MAYLLALPIIYYGTSAIASKILDLGSNYVLKNETLHDDSEALLLAAITILQKYKNMDASNGAFKNKLLLEDGVDSLKYASSTTETQWYKKNYHKENVLLERLQNDLERRLRLFLLVVEKN